MNTVTLELELLGVRGVYSFGCYSFDTIQRAYWSQWCRKRFAYADSEIGDDCERPESFECEGE